MNKDNLQKAMKEVSVIIKEALPDEKINLINEKFRNFLEENKDKQYEFTYDSSKDIDEQEVLYETKLLLAVIYINYLATPEEKESMINKLDENEKKYLKELNEKYSVDNLFDGKKEKEYKKDNVANDNVENNNLPIEYHESFIKKIINKIKNIFRKEKKK